MELWITKGGAEIQVSSQLDTSFEEHYFEALLLFLDLQSETDSARLGALCSEEEKSWDANRGRAWCALGSNLDCSDDRLFPFS